MASVSGQPGEIDWLLATGWFGVTWIGVWLMRPVATFLHELGHAIPALLFTRELVEIRVGGADSADRAAGDLESTDRDIQGLSWSAWGRFHWVCSFRGSFQGFTGYDRDSLDRGGLLTVIAGGPLVSFLSCCLAGWLMLSVAGDTVSRMTAAVFLCSNAIVFLRSVVPVSLKNGEPSDALDFWNTLRKKS